MRYNVKESFNHEVLPFVDETLSQLLDCVSAGVWTFTQLNIISSSYLTLLLNLFSFNLIANLLAISKCIVFPNFS